MDKMIEYTSRSRLRRSTAIARRLTDLASVTTSSRTASGGTFTCPSIAAFPIVTSGGQIVTHSLTAYSFTATTRNCALNFSSKIQNGKCINVGKSASLPNFGRLPIQEIHSGSKRCPRDSNGTVRSRGYPRRAKLVAERRVYLAGYRLAVLLSWGEEARNGSYAGCLAHPTPRRNRFPRRHSRDPGSWHCGKLPLTPTAISPISNGADSISYDERGVGLSYADAEECGVHILKVAGVSYRQDVLQRPEFAPGTHLRLRAEKNNAHDANAVSVWDRNGRAMVGYVSKGINVKIRTALTLPDCNALALAEHRKDGRRVSLTVMFGPLSQVNSN